MSVSTEQCIELSGKLYRKLGEQLEILELDDTPRAHLTDSMGRIAIEHGISVCALISMESLTSAIALLRVQFEAVIRAIWFHHAATEETVLKWVELVATGSLEEPVNTPTISQMLSDPASTAPPVVLRMLNDLKLGAWGPLNSYVHGGIHPVMQFHRGYPPDYAIQTLRNANGLTTMAAMLLAVAAGDAGIAKSMRQTQLDHLHCLPPLVT